MNRRRFFALIGLGVVARLAEHLPRKQTVLGSIPSGTSNMSAMDLHLASIDPETVARSMSMPNWGTIEGTPLERWGAFQRELKEAAIHLGTKKARQEVA
jgi:diacylglycerol kinase family enzyme